MASFPGTQVCAHTYLRGMVLSCGCLQCRGLQAAPPSPCISFLKLREHTSLSPSLLTTLHGSPLPPAQKPSLAFKDLQDTARSPVLPPHFPDSRHPSGCALLALLWLQFQIQRCLGPLCICSCSCGSLCLEHFVVSLSPEVIFFRLLKAPWAASFLHQLHTPTHKLG